jgi:ATP-dependent Clp protease ATP-binding subunit ClpB
LGSDVLASLKPGEPSEMVRDEVMEIVRSAFRPEFLNRLDEIILFDRLRLEDMKGIVEIQLQRLNKLLSEQGLSVSLSNEAEVWMAEKGYDPVYGARPLKRVFQKELQNKIANLILEEKAQKEMKVSVVEGQLLVS